MFFFFLQIIMIQPWHAGGKVKKSHLKTNKTSHDTYKDSRGVDCVFDPIVAGLTSDVWAGVQFMNTESF